MKRILVWLVVLALVVFTAAPVWADRGPGGDDGDRSGQQSDGNNGHDADDDADNSSNDSHDDATDNDSSNDDGNDDADDEVDDPNDDANDDADDSNDDVDDDLDDSDDDVSDDANDDLDNSNDDSSNGQKSSSRQQDRTDAATSGSFDLSGVILRIDRATGLVTIGVLDANKPARVMQQVMVHSLARTRLQQRSGSIWVSANLGDLRAGQSILARGTINGDTWTASRIRVGKRL
jgi:hypothetical protein